MCIYIYIYIRTYTPHRGRGQNLPRSSPLRYSVFFWGAAAYLRNFTPDRNEFDQSLGPWTAEMQDLATAIDCAANTPTENEDNQEF